MIWSESGAVWFCELSLLEDIVLVEEMELNLEEGCDVGVGVSEEIVK